jgi:hypothetical protein
MLRHHLPHLPTLQASHARICTHPSVLCCGRLSTASIVEHTPVLLGCSALVLWTSMHVRAQEPADANAARPDSPIDVHRNESQADAQQSGSGGPGAPGSNAQSCQVPAAPLQQAARLMGRRLKVSISFTRFSTLIGCVFGSCIDV